MKFIPFLMDLIPVDPVTEEEIAKEVPNLPAGGIIAVGIVVVAAVLTGMAIKKNKK